MSNRLVHTEIAPDTPEVLNEHSGAFTEVEIDPIKLANREEVTESLSTAKQSSWGTETDTREGVCGFLSQNCFRTRHKSTQECLPSFAMLEVFPALDPEIDVSQKSLPSYQFTSYETSKHREIKWEGMRMEIPNSTSIYGMGENAGGLLLNEMANYESHEHIMQYDQRRGLNKKTGKPIPEKASNHYPRPRNNAVCWNTDSVFYDESYESLYQSHPWVLLVTSDGSSLGVFVDSTYRTIIHLCKEESCINLYFLSEAPKGAPPIYFFPAETPQNVLRELSLFTGHMKLPPKWALGYQQCRYSYYPDTTVKRIAKTFREKKIPCDVIWMDIHYMDEYKCFTFDKEHFPDPNELNRALHEQGFKSVWMIDPGIKHMKNYPVYDSGTAGGHWIKHKEGSNAPAIGKVWPGKTVFPDFLQEKTREWWSELFQEYMATGIDGVWNDMNEIASFQDGSTIPWYSYHHADEEIGGPDSNIRYHNVYGMMMTRASFNGIQKANPDKRPFVLTRANFMGGQRYAACWTGDNSSSWKHLHFSIPMVLNMGLSAQPFVGVDIGGFFENASPELYARWVGIGAMLPFARGHSCDGTDDHEPWSFDKMTEDTCRRAIERRYKLLPYYYTAFYDSSRTGLPIAQPLFFVDPADPTLREIDDAFLVGENILIRAYTTPDRESSWKLPSKYKWHKLMILDDVDESTDTNLPDLYQKSGSIVPVGPLVQFVNDKVPEKIELHVFLDEENKATGSLYEDAGEGYGYQSGDFALFAFSAHQIGNNIAVSSRKVDGNRNSTCNSVRVHLISKSGKLSSVETNSLVFHVSFKIVSDK